MNSLLDEEEEEGKTSEITLSTASLLGIFFGLVLICGVFFGFGYSMGRGTGSAPATVATAEPEETPAPGPPRPAALAPAEQDEAPAAAAPAPAVARVQHDDAPGDETTVAPAKAPGGRPSAAQKIPASLPAEPDTSAAAVSGKPMVQIAAVARPEDADALVAALRQRGYGVVVRNEPQDKLLHVQVGPFADRGEAAAMKQKLLSDGYNAIIKQ
jgi:septal ring-binding cell division protein DamX